MNLILGGAYQGKLEYAKNTYHFTDADIFTCTDTEIDFNSPCITSVEEFTYACVKANIDAVDYFKRRREQWLECVIICQDISCGVVPLGADLRAWRYQTGQLCQYLSREAESVTRIFCGLEQKLK